MSDDRDGTVRRQFGDAVNMTAGQIEKFLETEDSKRVGQKNGGESVGHASGRHIIRILGKKTADLTPDDYKHTRKVVGYVKRHSAQRPDGDVTDTVWRYSLMNWGHDPNKEG